MTSYAVLHIRRALCSATANEVVRTMGGFALKSAFSASAASAAADGLESGSSSFVMKAVRCTSAPCNTPLHVSVVCVQYTASCALADSTHSQGRYCRKGTPYAGASFCM